jgi:glycerol-3-phosphate acyltransferase PlsX
VIDGALLAIDEDPEMHVLLVGPPEVAESALTSRNRAGALDVVAATQLIDMTEDPARAVRAKRDATVRVAARLVRDGTADAVVSVGSTGAALAAAVFTLGTVPGMSRAPLAVVIPAARGPVVLLDAGASVDCDADLLTQFALAGVTYAGVVLGIEHPRVGLLTVGAEPGKGDMVRKAAYDGIAAALDGVAAEFVGNVEGHDVPLGGRADVVVTDGFTGNVLLKAVEGTLAMVGEAVAADAADDERLSAAFQRAMAPLDPAAIGGAVLLGVAGVVVVGHGSSSPRAVASCIQLATRSVRDDLVPQTAARLAGFIAQRGTAAGQPARFER